MSKSTRATSLGPAARPVGGLLWPRTRSVPKPTRALLIDQPGAAAVSAPRRTPAGLSRDGSKPAATWKPATPSPLSRVIGTVTRCPGSPSDEPTQMPAVGVVNDGPKALITQVPIKVPGAVTTGMV